MASIIHREPLDLQNPEQLLLQLQEGTHDELLKKTDDSFVYPHCRLLRSFKLAGEKGRRDILACAKLMVAKKAPVDSARYTLVSVLITFDWNDETPEMNRELIELYANAGYLDPNKREPGTVQERLNPMFEFARGQTPVAAAITYDHADALEFFLRHGGSEDLGIVSGDRPPRTAQDYAVETEAVKCLAFFNARAMRQALEESSIATPSQAPTASRRRTGV